MHVSKALVVYLLPIRIVPSVCQVENTSFAVMFNYLHCFLEVFLMATSEFYSSLIWYIPKNEQLRSRGKISWDKMTNLSSVFCPCHSIKHLRNICPRLIFQRPPKTSNNWSENLLFSTISVKQIHTYASIKWNDASKIYTKALTYINEIMNRRSVHLMWWHEHCTNYRE